MGRPSSETATMPACFIAAISESDSPLLPIDAAPIGHTRTLETAAARSRIERVTDTLSFTGRVLGIGHTAVNPPRAAARVPVSMVSEDSPPGSRRWQCKSMKPGATTKFAASKISAPFARAASSPCGATAAMRSPSSRMSRGTSVPLAGSSTRPLLISSMRRILFRGRVRATAGHQEEQRHADGQSVGDLLEHARLRPVGDGRIDFKAPDHGSRMEHERIGPRKAQALWRELVLQDVLVEWEWRLMQAFLLHAKRQDNVGAFERFGNARDAANRSARRPQAFELAGQPHRGTAESEAASEFREQVNIRARHAAVKDVAEDCDVQAFQSPAAVADRQRVEERLRGVLVRPIARVDHREREMARGQVGRGRGTMSYYDTIRLHRIERAHRVEQRFAFLQAGGLGLKIHLIGSEPRRGRGGTDSRARRRLEKCQRDGFSAQRGEFFQRMVLNFLKWFRLIQQKYDFFGAKRFDAEHVAEAIWQNCPQNYGWRLRSWP